MFQKANYGFDYDDEYDYDMTGNYGGGYGVKGKERLSDRDKLVGKQDVWQCTICTYDNDENLSFCDICGAFRDPANTVTNGAEGKVDGIYKGIEASIMAKSLFAQTSGRKPISTLISDVYLSKEANKSSEKGKIHACFDDLQKGLIPPSCKRIINITAPFRFDTPSPDDIVSAGTNSSRTIKKVDSALSESVKASSSKAGKKAIIKFLSNEVSEEASASLSESSSLNECESDTTRDNEGAPQMLASNLHHLKLDKKSRNNMKVKSPAQYKPEKWMLSEQEGTLSQLNLAIVGHVDSGKSTLSGRLLHLSGRISKKEMHKYEKESKEKGKGSFAYAWAMDESAEERQRGVTMTVAVAYFDTQKYRIVLLDSPGHKDFIPTMISGVAQADAAILVVDASIGSFEAGMGGNGVGQTKEHAQLIRSFGVEQIIVAVNKMDVVQFSKERFDFINWQLGSFLRSCGFKDSYVTWIPLSVIENQNLLTTASDHHLSSWYQGGCLLDAIDALHPPQRDLSKPLLLPICDVITSYSLGQVAACGKLETGAIRSGSKVLVMPSGDLATVRSIERDSHACTVARAGDHVAVSLQGIDGSCVISGGVLCHPDFPPTVASSLELKVLVLEITTPILIGSQVEFQTHHAKVAARVVKIVSLLDQKTGKVSKKAPRFLTARQYAIIEVVLDGAVCVEEFANCRALGRAFLRASGGTIAVGIVTRVVKPTS